MTTACSNTAWEFSRRKLVALLAGAAAVPCLPSILRAAEAPGLQLRAVLDASARADARLDPLQAATRTVNADAPFVDPLGDAYARELEAARRRDAAGLQAIDRSGLTPVDRIAYDVLQYRTRQALHRFDSGLFQLARLAPLNPSFGLHVQFPDFVSGAGAPFAALADYEVGLARLEGFSGWLDMVTARLQEGVAAGVVQPRIIVENVLAQVDAMLALPIEQTPFLSALLRMPASIGAADRERLAAAYRRVTAERILPGYRRWQAYLRGTYLPLATEAPGRWAMKGGAELYAAELAHHTSTTKTADEIHALGLSEVARIRAEMEKVRGTIGFAGDLKTLFAHVRDDPKFYCRTPAELLARFAEIESRIWPAIPLLFHDRPKAPFRVAALPALGDQRGTGYYRPGPPDGVSPGTLFFNMSMLNTRPIPTLETLTLHEGIPGHHFQITQVREDASLPDILRFGATTAYSEGWGLYAESLGSELGLFQDPWQWFGHLDMEMLRAVRLVVDTGLHARRWSRQQAIDYMLDHTSMAPRDVGVEIDRYIAFPGQACAYKVGELTIARLRKEASERLGNRFDVRDFHREVLGTGALPMDVLEAKIGNWIART